MKHTGVQTRTGVVVPGLNSIKKTVSLTKEAKQRLNWIDFYESHKGKFAGYWSMDVSGDLRALYIKRGEELIIFGLIGTHSQLYG